MTAPNNPSNHHNPDETRQFAADGFTPATSGYDPATGGYRSGYDQGYPSEPRPYGYDPAMDGTHGVDYGDTPHYGSGQVASTQQRGRVRNASLSEMFDVQGLVTEAVIVSLVWGVLFGVIAWVVDLLAVRASDAGGGNYVSTGVGTFVLLGSAGAAGLAVAFVVRTLLESAVNDPDQVYNLLIAVVPLVAVIILLTSSSWWVSVPLMILLVIGAIPMWTLAPFRVANYRDETVQRRYTA